MSNQYLKLRRSAIPGKTPDTSSLELGEIALNTYDGLIFMKKSGSSGEEVITVNSTSGSFSGQFSGSFSGSGADLYDIPASGITGLNLSQISSGSVSASISPDNGLQVNTNIIAPSFTGSLFGTSSWASNADTSSYAPLYLPLVGGTITGDLSITQNLYVEGTASIQNIQYVSQSTLNIGTNLITVNTSTPATRFGGLAVYDSGSIATGLTGSLLWDSEKNRWIYSNPSGSSYDGGILLSGPRNTSGLGNEVGTLNNVIVKGQGGDHVTSSQMIDDGTTVSIPGNLVVTGSVIGIITTSSFASSGNGLFSGSFSGSGANLYNIPASGIVGLNLSQISTGSIIASVGLGTGSFEVVSGSTTLLSLSSSGYFRVKDGLYIGDLPLNYAPARINISSFGTKTEFKNSVMTLSSTETGAGGIYPTQLIFGQETSSAAPAGWSIQSVNQGVAYIPLILQQNGSNVLIGTKTDSGYKLDVNGSGRYTNGLTITGSLIANNITGSLQGTASWANNALTASYLSNYIPPFPFTGSAEITGSLIVIGNTTLTPSVTTGSGVDISSSTITTGNLMKLVNTGTAAASNTKSVLAIESSGANATSTQTVTGQKISITNTGTSSTNVGLSVSATGATNNYGLIVPSGNVGIGTSTPNSSYKLDIIGPTRIYPRGALGQSFTFDFADVYNYFTMPGNYYYIQQTRAESNSFLAIQSLYGDIVIGGNPSKGVYLGTSDTGISPVIIGGAGGSAIQASAILDIRSTTRGFLIPRMTSTQRNAISSPATGLMLIDNTTSTNTILNMYNGTGWGQILNSNPTVTASASLATGFNYTPSLTAAANNDVLVGLDVNPTFTTGSFTGVSNIGLRIKQNTSGVNSSPLILQNTQPYGTGGVYTQYSQQWLTSTGTVGGYVIGDISKLVMNGGVQAQQFLTGTVAGIVDNGAGRGASIGINGSPIDFGTATYSGGGTNIGRWFGTGNLLIQTAGTFTDVASSKLTINSTTSGFLQPRMTAAQLAAISSPATGLQAFQTDGTEGMYLKKIAGWKKVLDSDDVIATSAAANIFNYYNFR